MLLKISASINDLRLEFTSRLDSVRSDAQSQMQTLRAIKERLIVLEDRIPQDQISELSLLCEQREDKLMNELSKLRIEVQRLTRDNESLKNFRNPRKRVEPIIRPKINEFNIQSEIERSSSVVSSRDEKPFDEFEQLKEVREFRLDSEISRSFRPDNKFFAQTKIQNILESDDNDSVKTSRGPRPGVPKVSTCIFSSLNPIRMTQKNMSSALDDSQESVSKEIRKSRRTSGKFIPKMPSFEDDSSLNDNLDKRRMSLKNVKNFDDFQQILRDLKTTLNASTYASFNDNIDENLRNLEDMLRKYSTLDEQIHSLYQQSVNTFKFEKRASVKLEIPPLEDLSERLAMRSNSFMSSGNPNYLLKELQLLKSSSNFALYEGKLKEIQRNPMEFESFIIKIKQEFKKRESEFLKIENQLLINNQWLFINFNGRAC